MVVSPLPVETTQGARRLAAVWFADIVGYSALASQDERAALAQIRAFQTTCLTAIERFGGRLVKFIGDAAFAEFASTESALRAAIALADAFGRREPGAPGRDQLRIGLHVGDVVAAPDGDIYGDGINLAARLQREARPGQILISGDVRRQLRSNRAFAFHSIGSRDLRGMRQPVEIFAVDLAEARSPGARRSSFSPALFLRELRRRYVFRAAAIYVIVAWGVIQVAATIGPPLGLPGWTTRLVIVLATLGFPVALVLAWAFEVTPEGIARTGAVNGGAAALENDRVDADPRPASSNGSVRPISVAADPGTFVGRENELRRIEALLASPECRLITITGPGGIGKTRLATQVGTLCAAHFEEGAWVVPLAGHESASAVLPAIAEQFRLPLEPGVDTKAQLIDFLREKEVLVVIDNFEQLTDSAGLLSEILSEAPRAKFLVTSRERLNLRLETVISLQGLDCGGEGGGEENEARRLFLQSARRVVPDFDPGTSECEAIEELCRAVEGIPLAIELAAGWTRVLPCQEILNEMRVDTDFLASELRDVPERHRSLHAVFESSWRLLTEEERRAFRRLSVFVGSFDREAARTVAGVTINQLSSLLDQSLLRSEGDGRFRMLEVLRQYAAEKLAEDAQEDEWARGKFASYYLDLLEALQPELRGASGEASLGRIALDLENIRRAWSIVAAEGRVADLDRALEPLFTFFNVRGRVREGEELLTLASKAAEKPNATGARGNEGLALARIRIRRGVFCAHLGRYEAARSEIEAGLSDARQLGRSTESAFALENLGRVAFNRGAYGEARKLHLESQTLYEASGDHGGSGRASIFLGNLAYVSGDYAEASRLYSESVGLLREANDRNGVASSLCNLGVLASTQGNYEGAEPLLLESLSIARELDDRRGVATALQTLGVNAVLAGRVAQAEEYLLESIAISREMGFRRYVAFALNALGRVYIESDRARRAAETYREALDLGEELGEDPLIMDSIVGFARLWSERDLSRSLSLLTFVLSHPATDQPTREVAAPLAENFAGALPEAEAEAATTAGRELDLDLAFAACRAV